MVRPDGFAIPARAAAVHGITTERALAEGQPISAVLADFARDLRALRPAAVVAHNARYDLPIVAAEFERLGAPDPCRRLRVLCTMLQCRAAWPRAERQARRGASAAVRASAARRPRRGR